MSSSSEGSTIQHALYLSLVSIIYIKPTAAKIAASITPGSIVIPGCKAWAADESSPPSLSLSEAAVSPGAAAAFAARHLAFIDVKDFVRAEVNLLVDPSSLSLSLLLSLSLSSEVPVVAPPAGVVAT